MEPQNLGRKLGKGQDIASLTEAPRNPYLMDAKIFPQGDLSKVDRSAVCLEVFY